MKNDAPSAGTVAQGTSQVPPGMTCPRCEQFQIRLSLDQILYSDSIKCGRCGLKLSIDRSSSGRLMDLLQNLNVATKDVELLKRKYSAR